MQWNLSTMAQAHYRYSGPGKCTCCGEKIEWWTPLNSTKRAFDPMLTSSSPVVPHRCERIPQVAKRQAVMW
jgi:hypothetical protein